MPDEIRLPFVTVQYAIRQLPSMSHREIRTLVAELGDSLRAIDRDLERPQRPQLKTLQGTSKRQTNPRGKLALVKGDDDAE